MRRHRSKAKPASQPGPRGWSGRGGGASRYLQAADEWRGTTVQVCGLWPFAAGSGSPRVGVPLGRNLLSGATLCADPISWFQRAKLISRPSLFLLGEPGLGKSSVVRRMCLGLAGYGVHPLVLGDLKPDYVELIRALGGQVIEAGRARNHINVLDPGDAADAARRLTGQHRSRVLADAHGRRLQMMAGLLTIIRAAGLTDREEIILDRALQVLDDRHPGVPVPADLLQVIQDAPDELRQVALDRGDLERYHDLTDQLQASLVALVSGALGGVFTGHTTERMHRDRPVVFDVSSIDEGEHDVQAAVLLSCWGSGFGTVSVANALADAGVEPRRHYFVVLDELWRALRSGGGVVDRIDSLTRLDRAKGVGTAMISHTMKDLTALPDQHDRDKAAGFVERSGMVILGGLPGGEMPQLTPVVPLSAQEQTMLTSWSDPPSFDPTAGAETEPPGRGHFLVKVGGRAGIPIRTQLTATELRLGDTNRLWHDEQREAAA